MVIATSKSPKLLGMGQRSRGLSLSRNKTEFEMPRPNRNRRHPFVLSFLRSHHPNANPLEKPRQ